MDLQHAKFNMVEQQIRPWSVLSPQVLETMSAVPREKFVPEKYRHFAFADMEVPISDGQFMMQPKVEARLLQALSPQANDLVLEIGAGSGHCAALLGHCAREVHSIELRSRLCQMAENNLSANGVTNVRIVEGDAGKGWHSDTQYNCIFVSGSYIELPHSLLELLCLKGKLVAVIGEEPVMKAVFYRRTGDAEWEVEYLFETFVAPLDNIQQPDRFEF